ncbi:unnamed protein product [Caenorhabditis brenneri]
MLPCHFSNLKFKYYLAILQIASIFGTFVSVVVNFEKIENLRKHPLYILTSFFSIIVTYGFYILVKMLTLVWDYHRNPGRLVRCRRDLLVGYGMIAICGIIPQILVMFVQRKEIIYTCATICNFAFIAIFLLLILQHFEFYKIKNTNDFKEIPRIIAVICHLLYAVAVMKITKTWNKERKELVASVVIFYSITFSLVTAEFFAVLWTGISLEEPTRSSVPLRAVGCSVEPPPKHSDAVLPTQPTVTIKLDQDTDSILRDNNYRHNGSECNICSIEYSNLVIPRILIGCGHTICEGFFWKLLRNDEFQNRVLCPFCRKITRMSGANAKELPKNYAILEMIEERKRDGN